MAPHGEAIASAYSRTNAFSKPPRLSNGNLHRAKSDLTFELSKETADINLPPISEVEDAKCECCGMSEECTPEYIDRVRNKFLGKWVCGLCSEAVKEEMEKNGGHKEEALNEHMSACARFNKFGRAFPVLSQAEAMREILKKSAIRAKSISPKGAQKMGGIAREFKLHRSNYQRHESSEVEEVIATHLFQLALELFTILSFLPLL